MSHNKTIKIQPIIESSEPKLEKLVIVVTEVFGQVFKITKL